MKHADGSMSRPAQARLPDEPLLQQGAVISAAGLAPMTPAFANSASRSPSASAEQEIRTANTHYSRGEFAVALDHYAAAVRLAPDNSGHHFRLGCCAWDVGNRQQALDHLQQAIRLNPHDAAAHEALGQMLMECGLKEPALEHSAIAVQLEPDNPSFAVSRAMVLETNRQSDAAWEIIDRLLKRGFSSPRLALLFSRIARQRKRDAKALEMVQRELAAPPQRRIDNIALNFAAAELLDRVGRYDEAFAHARQANQLVGAKYEPAQVERSVDALIAYFTRRKIQSLPRSTLGDERPVFIVGMPRSGTSLVEQILASHPDVYGAGELEAIFQIAGQAEARLSGRGFAFPQSLDGITSSLADELAANYLRPLTALAPAARRITDKLPLNFLQLGLISILFPQARVIHCMRDPRDTCLSCYMTHFSSGNEFSYDLRSCGHFYRQYEKLMTHWKRALDLPILDVIYGQLVEDAEGQSRRMVEFLGLPWDPQCLRFYDNTRYVPTASNAQVRQPIYQSSVGRWRHYDKHLAPLLAALGWG